MEVQMRAVGSIKPYDNNPRDNDAAVDAVAASIEEFGFRQPVVVDEQDVIIVGHTRYKAALKLGMKEVPVRYLFEERQEGAPDKIKGVRYVINQNMDDTMVSGKKTMLAGAFRKFKIRDVGVLRVKKLEERYAELDQVGFIAFLRSDSKVLDAGTGPIRHLVHP